MPAISFCRDPLRSERYVSPNRETEVADQIRVGDRVQHYKYGEGVVVSLISQGLAEVRFGAAVEYVEQRNLISHYQKERAEQRRIERARQEALSKRRYLGRPKRSAANCSGKFARGSEKIFSALIHFFVPPAVS
jgi:hypothetical protein